MSRVHPIVAVIGASGAGKTVVKKYFYNLFKDNDLPVAIVEGDSFHRYPREEMAQKARYYKQLGRSLTHYSYHANNLKQLQELFGEYSSHGTGKRRYYVHNEHEAEKLGQRFGVKLEAGAFTPLEDLPENTKVLFYEGLHGGAVDKGKNINVVRFVDLLIGVVPTINLEWKQKITRDVLERGYEPYQVIESITERLPDYIDFMIPQFSRTHINIQRIPLIDTSDPFLFKEKEHDGLWQKHVLIAISVRNLDIDMNEVKNSIEGAQITLENNLIIQQECLRDALDKIVKPQLMRIGDNFKGLK